MSQWFSSIVIAVFRGHGWSETHNLTSHQFISRCGVTFTNWHAITQSIGPNYRALFSGDTWGNEAWHGHFRPSLVSELRHAGVEAVQWNYKGVPAYSPFRDFVTPGVRMVDGLNMDLNQMPPRCLLFVGMDEDNNGDRDGENGLVRADGNLRNLIGHLDASVWFNSTIDGKYPMLFVVWDEDVATPDENHVWAALYGRAVKANFRDVKHYNHYSLVKTCMANWNLPGLNETNRPVLLTDVWK